MEADIERLRKEKMELDRAKTSLEVQVVKLAELQSALDIERASNENNLGEAIKIERASIENDLREAINVILRWRIR